MKTLGVAVGLIIDIYRIPVIFPPEFPLFLGKQYTGKAGKTGSFFLVLNQKFNGGKQIRNVR